MNTKHQIIPLISDFLNNQEDIVFAYIFGSFATKEKYQDIDIAIYTSNDPNLLRLGELQTELLLVTSKKIDLLHLNNLYKQNPSLSHEILSTGMLIVDKEPLTQKHFKERALLKHFDNAELNSIMRKAFASRIRERKIGLRNYAK